MCSMVCSPLNLLTEHFSLLQYCSLLLFILEETRLMLFRLLLVGGTSRKVVDLGSQKEREDRDTWAEEVVCSHKTSTLYHMCVVWAATASVLCWTAILSRTEECNTTSSSFRGSTTYVTYTMSGKQSFTFVISPLFWLLFYLADLTEWQKDYLARRWNRKTWRVQNVDQSKGINLTIVCVFHTCSVRTMLFSINV